ncbi:MAG: hypothetical protein MI919_39025, partial [Holophagales bacterium]|nr:hypothetical protein [Holophagales bacterium]
VTTAVTFLAFLVSDFEGLWELGLLTGGGILLVLSSVFVLLPAVLAVVDRVAPGRVDRPPVPLRGFGSTGLFLLCHRRPGPALALNLALSVLLGALALDVVYDDDALSMRSSSNEGLVQQGRIMDAFGLRFTPYMVRVDGATERQALERARRLLPELEALEDGERLARVESALPWIPPYALQEQRLAQLQAAGLEAGAVRARFEMALGARGLRAAAFSDGLYNLERALTLDHPRGPSDLAATSLGHALSRYVAVGSREDGTEVASTVIYAYPPPGKWRREPPPDLVRIVESSVDRAGGTDGEPWAVLTGGVIVSNELKRVVWRDALLAGILGTLGVFLFLAWDLRSFAKALLALLPLAIGLVWMLGWMSLAGMAVNFMNIFV